MSTTEPHSAEPPRTPPETPPTASPSPASSPDSVIGSRAGEAAALRLAVFRLARRLRAERAVDTMSDAQHLVLAVLHHEGPMSLGELATHERVSAPSMNRTVNCLEDGGYVSRGSDSVDRRRVTVTITDTGIAVVEEVKRLRTKWLAQVMAELSEEERALLAAAAPVLNRVAGL